MNATPKKVFISYSHKDEAFKESLDEHLCLMQRNGLVDIWHDRKIIPGQEWDKQIDARLEQAELIIFLVSSSFIASSYCYDIEVQKAIELHEQNKAVLVPVIVRACDWHDAPFGKFQGLPKDAKAIATWEDADTAWLHVVKGLKNTVNQFIPANPSLPAVIENIPSLNKSDYIDWLEDTEVVFTHRQVDRVSLSDVYTWPDFRLLNDESGSKKDYVSAESILTGEGFHLVFGEEQQGKTALLKSLYLRFIEKGILTLYVDAKNIKKSDLADALKNTIHSQYNGMTEEDFMAQDNKVLLIDNLDQIKLNTRYQVKFIDQVNEIFKNVIITAHESFNLVVVDNPGLNDYEAYELLGFGHHKREEMTRRWVSLGIEESISESDMYEKSDHLKSQLSAIIKKNIVPPKPIYVLLLLQMFEAYSDQNLELTSFGHCYQKLIYTSFENAKIRNQEINAYLNVLTEFAWALYLNKEPLNAQKVDGFFVEYERDFLPVDKNEVLTKLKQHSILVEVNGELQFKYPYIYYFFVGKKIADSYIDNDSVKIEVDHLLDTLHREDSANILIFITHHTKNSWVLGKIQGVLNHLFEEQVAATLDKEQLAFMNDFIEKIPVLVLEKREVHEERENHNRDLDRIEQEGDSEDESLEKFDTLAMINKTFKGMEIAGQIIRNRHANLSRSDLSSLADEGACAGLRALDYFIEISDHAKIEIVKYIEKKLENHPSLSNQEVAGYAEKAYLHLTYGVISAIVRKISSSIGSKDAMAIYEQLGEKKNTPAFYLIKQSIELQHKRELKIESIENTKEKLKSNPVCLRILKEMVLQHIYMFPVDFKKQQQLASSLGISVPGQQIMKRKLIGKG
ncbi:MAG: toll/interleukin-1 receptor domain-containing protein [Methyloprofundus sp.]|nr:toll/interleukin-1 receptor domain-containing protein [Methyloprofundus sp.]